MCRQTICLPWTACGNLLRSRSTCRFSITKMRSAQRRWPSVTLTRAPRSVPADRAVKPSIPCARVSAVRLRQRFWLQMKRSLVVIRGAGHTRAQYARACLLPRCLSRQWLHEDVSKALFSLRDDSDDLPGNVEANCARVKDHVALRPKLTIAV